MTFNELRDVVCVQHPHLFKPMQAVNAVIILISIGSATPVDGSGVLWFVSLFSLMISTIATVIFIMDKNEETVYALTSGLLSWNVLEFVYSAVLTVLCAISFWLAFGYTGHVPKDGRSAGYVFAGTFLILQTLFYGVPTFLIYDRIQSTETSMEVDGSSNPFRSASVINGDEQRYQQQNERII